MNANSNQCHDLSLCLEADFQGFFKCNQKLMSSVFFLIPIVQPITYNWSIDEY